MKQQGWKGWWRAAGVRAIKTMAQTAVEQALSAAGAAPLLSVAPRDCLGPAHVVCRRSVCKR